MKHTFIARNRLISGLSDAVLVTEAAERSGSLLTADFALEQGRTVLAVPGSITSAISVGTNNLIKSGALTATESADMLQAIGLNPLQTTRRIPTSKNPNEQTLLDLLATGLQGGDELLFRMLEIRGHIRPLGNNQWALQY